MDHPITAQRLRDLLHYEPETGSLRWRALSSTASRVHIGDISSAGAWSSGTGWALFGVHPYALAKIAAPKVAKGRV